MKEIPLGDLDLAVVSHKDGVPRCVVTLPTGAVTTVLFGRQLDACVATPLHYILFLSNDLIYDERLHIYLVDTQATVLDQARLGALDTAAFLSELTMDSAERIQFSFFGGDCWEILLHETPRSVWNSLFSGSPWVWRPRLRRRYFDLRSVE
ncbi:hypothetical protein [Corticimicrobacter populi]|uniref:Uncharacterized protein n=1 Tax=Corticimicrobacter populi TaxID=2175229 RepID=A0A2V1JWD5_9BURK|nr:hypothetical protein [Corticimicrobacter populi]PWF21448.1 hypothetical protein DD235_14330 [Corticimicrobacter populi]